MLRKNIEETKAFIKLCHDVGGSGVKVRPNGLPAGVPVDKTLEQIGKSLDEVAAFGEGYGVEIRLEIHGRGTSEIPEHPQDHGRLETSRLEAVLELQHRRHWPARAWPRISPVRPGSPRHGAHPRPDQRAIPGPSCSRCSRKPTFRAGRCWKKVRRPADPLRVMQYYRLVWETLAS